MLKEKENTSFYETDVMSKSLLSVMEDLSSSKNCKISKYLHEMRNVSPSCRPYFMCDILTGLSFKCESNSILFSFLPKSKIAKARLDGESAESISSLRQTGSPAKVAMTFINDKRPTEKIPTVPVQIVIVNNDMSETVKTKQFWFDEEEGVAYNDAENVFEFKVSPDVQIKAAKKQYTLFNKDDFEKFANYVKNNFLCNFEFVILKGDDISKYYYHSNYYKGNGEKGTLWKSCMRSCDRKLFDYYTQNPDTINMLAVMYEGKLLGRANMYKSTKGWVLDRIYSYEDYILESIIDYCIENKITYKTKYQSPRYEDDWMVYNPEKKKHERIKGYPIEIVIKHSFREYKEYPYIDTFHSMGDRKLAELDNCYLLTNYRYEYGDCEGHGEYFSWAPKTPAILKEYEEKKKSQ